MSGALDQQAQCTQFRTLYEEELPKIKNAVLDCSELQNFGPYGVTELFRFRELLQEKSGKLCLLNPSNAVESVWKIMHLESLIPKIADLKSSFEKTP